MSVSKSRTFVSMRAAGVQAQSSPVVMAKPSDRMTSSKAHETSGEEGGKHFNNSPFHLFKTYVSIQEAMMPNQDIPSFDGRT